MSITILCMKLSAFIPRVFPAFALLNQQIVKLATIWNTAFTPHAMMHQTKQKSRKTWPLYRFGWTHALVHPTFPSMSSWDCWLGPSHQKATVHIWCVFPWSQTNNNWTSKESEPELHFPGAFERFCTWIWNLRITYPTVKIYLVDDDIQAAFRLMSYHPNMISMHGFQILARIIFYCRATFDDGSSPPNFDPIAVARQQ